MVGLLMNTVTIFIMRDYWKVQFGEGKEFKLKKTLWQRASGDKTQKELFLTFTDTWSDRPEGTVVKYVTL